MRTNLRPIVALASIAILISAPLYAESMQAPDTTSGLRVSLPKDANNPDWKERRDAFYRLIRGEKSGVDYEHPTPIATSLSEIFKTYPERKGIIDKYVIQLLENENRLGKVVRGTVTTEEYSDYYGDVIAATLALNDPRSIHAMLGAIDTGGMAIRSLSSFGRQALQPVLGKMQDRDAQVRNGAAFVLGAMVDRSNPQNLRNDPVSRRQIKLALLMAARDRNFGVRDAAVISLAKLGDRDLIPLLRQIAATDPAKIPGRTDEGKASLYPVRLAAQRGLSAIESSQPH